MNVLADEQEQLIQRTVRELLTAECSPALVRKAEASAEKYSLQLWRRFAELGWAGLGLAEDEGGQALPIGCLGIVFEEAGRHIAPIPLHSTMVPAMVLSRFGTATQKSLLPSVAVGESLLSFAVQESNGAWWPDVRTVARRRGGDLVVDGVKYFVDGATSADKCLVVARVTAADGSDEGLACVLVDLDAAGVSVEPLVPTAKDSHGVVSLKGVRVPGDAVVGNANRQRAAVDALMDLAAVLGASLMEGAARRMAEMAVDYVNQREAFGQPIGAFQSIQHMAADMINAVDATQLLAREALWRIGQGLPAAVEVSQAKSFANDKCLMVARMAQQFHGGIGFIAEFDLNLWYRRVVSWGLRFGTTYEHRARIASALLDTPGDVRLGREQALPDNA